MLVEDTEDDYLITSKFLKKLDCVDVIVTWCQSSSEALKICQSESFDMFIFDYQIDEMSGVELAQKVKEITKSQTTKLSTPSIILTSVVDQDVAIEAMHVGVDDFVAKSHLSSACLERALSNVLSKHRLKEKVARKTIKIQQINEELEKANIKLEMTNQQLLKRNDEIGRFYQTVSHELKTPLTSIREFISIILDGIAGPINKDQEEYLTIAFGGCKQMVLYINDLLDVTRLDNQKLTLEKKSQSVEDVINQVVAFMAPKIKVNQIHLSVDVEPHLPLLEFDADRIKQVLMNMISNALKFTQTDGSLAIKSWPSAGCVNITVSDTGKGIHKNDLPHIFDRLYQVEDSERMSQHGLGLGLYICKEIIKLHDGDISVESDLGDGTTFKITLPVLPEESRKVANA